MYTSKLLGQLWDYGVKHTSEEYQMAVLSVIIRDLDPKYQREILKNIIRVVWSFGDEVQFEKLGHKLAQFVDYALKQEEIDPNKMDDLIERVEHLTDYVLAQRATGDQMTA